MPSDKHLAEPAGTRPAEQHGAGKRPVALRGLGRGRALSEGDEGAQTSTETGTRTVLQAALGPAQNLDIILSSNKGGTQGINCYRHEGRNESLSVKFTSIECSDPEGHDFTAWLGQPEPE